MRHPTINNFYSHPLAIFFSAVLLVSWQAESRESRLGLAVASVGTWGTYGNLDGFSASPYSNGLKRYEFNKLLALGLYGTLWDQPAYISLPWQWTAKRFETGTKNRFALGDGEIYIGQKIVGLETRLGLIFPTGYDVNNADPWIGPGTFQATLGVAVNPNFTRFSQRWEFSAEGKWSYSLNDAIAKSGSWAFFPAGKLSFRPVEKWKLGLEGMGYWKSSYWNKSANFGQSVFGWEGPKRQWSAGLVPVFFEEYYFTPILAMGLKAGHSLWGYHDAVSYNASAYLLYFL